MATMQVVPALGGLPAIDEESGSVNVIVETPKGSRGKFKYDDKTGGFLLHKILPVGFAFPLDFGFVPSTMAADGDPIDVLLLLDVPVTTGIIVKTKLIGAIEAEQKEPEGKFVRNDRLLGVAVEVIEPPGLEDIAALPDRMLEQLEQFFLQGKEFRPLRRTGPEAAMALLRESIAAQYAG